MSQKNVLDQCVSFELRGPAHASLTEVKGNNTIVRRAETDWSAVVKGKSLIDNRTTDLLDLYPRPRNVLSQMTEMMNAATAETAQGNKPPGMR